MRERVPSEDTTLVIMKNAGHRLNIEFPDAFNHELLAFLARVTP